MTSQFIQIDRTFQSQAVRNMCDRGTVGIGLQQVQGDR